MKAIVWRESVYKTWKCPKCGRELIGEDHKPVNVKMSTLNGEDWVFCDGCDEMVAVVKEYTGNAESGAMLGKWQGDL